MKNTTYKKNTSYKIPVVVMSFFLFTKSFSAGILFSEAGTDEIALAGAGSSSRAQDASVLLTNPAGSARLDENLYIGSQLLKSRGIYDTNTGETFDIGGLLPNVSMFYTRDITDKLSFGYANYTAYGLSADYGNWSGRNAIKKTTQFGVTFMPSLSYKVTDDFSVGIGVGIDVGYFAFRRTRLNGIDVDDNDFDIRPTYEVGFLYELSDRTRFGLAYSEEVDYEFDLDFSDSNNLSLNFLSYKPRTIDFSSFHQLNDKWAVMGTFRWENWKSYANNDIKINGVGQGVSDIYDNTFSLKLGVQYYFNDKLTINTGVAFESSIYDTQSDTSLTLSTGDSWRYGIGLKYKISNRSTVGASFEYLSAEDSNVKSNTFGGNYDTTELYVFGLSYSLDL